MIASGFFLIALSRMGSALSCVALPSVPGLSGVLQQVQQRRAREDMAARCRVIDVMGKAAIASRFVPWAAPRLIARAQAAIQGSPDLSEACRQELLGCLRWALHVFGQRRGRT